MTPRKLKTDPEFVELPPQKIAIVRATGAPSEVFPKIMPALYGSVYTLRFDRKKLGLPVPEDTTALSQKEPATEVTLETWQYGTVGQILHLGDYGQEEESVARLQRLITDEGYRVSGVHEKEYLTRPGAKAMKTIIRYPVVRQGKD